MQFSIKRDKLLKSLNFVQGIVEKKNTLPILSNVLLQLKDKKLSIVATDLDIIFYDEITDIKVPSHWPNKIPDIIKIGDPNPRSTTQNIAKMKKYIRLSIIFSLM